ncbi:THAP domain-containing protein 1-like [Cydia pomonella]|uniref:THAP domain-containing protein 1-like n=1 Tax=Cydia pomonella TaxID=82600 RepID=UPI002ADE5363|nr:THAP domain-containing protein 1-like [Cydia pomonella]
MVGCSVVACKSNSLRKEAGVTFHAFPTEDEIVREWIAGTGKSNWMPHKYSRICSKHFERHCVRKLGKRTYIEKFSVPTLFIHERREKILFFIMSWKSSIRARRRRGSLNSILKLLLNFI